MLLLMALLCSFVSCQGGRVHLIRLSKEVEFVSPINCPSGFVVIMMCHDDHQKMNGFLTRLGSWDFALHLMRGGGATRVRGHVASSDKWSLML